MGKFWWGVPSEREQVASLALVWNDCHGCWAHSLYTEMFQIKPVMKMTSIWDIFCTSLLPLFPNKLNPQLILQLGSTSFTKGHLFQGILPWIWVWASPCILYFIWKGIIWTFRHVFCQWQNLHHNMVKKKAWGTVWVATISKVPGPP